MSAKTEARSDQWVNLECVCGQKGGAYLRHYDVVRCSCGKAYWALQPQRGGPLVARPWPGLYSRERMAA